MGASLQIPNFTKGQDHLPAEQIERTRHIASVQIHTERITDRHTEVYYIQHNWYTSKGMLSTQIR